MTAATSAYALLQLIAADKAYWLFCLAGSAFGGGLAGFGSQPAASSAPAFGASGSVPASPHKFFRTSAKQMSFASFMWPHKALDAGDLGLQPLLAVLLEALAADLVSPCRQLWWICCVHLLHAAMCAWRSGAGRLPVLCRLP